MSCAAGKPNLINNVSQQLPRMISKTFNSPQRDVRKSKLKPARLDCWIYCDKIIMISTILTSANSAKSNFKSALLSTCLVNGKCRNSHYGRHFKFTNGIKLKEWKSDATRSVNEFRMKERWKREKNFPQKIFFPKIENLEIGFYVGIACVMLWMATNRPLCF